MWITLTHLKVEHKATTSVETLQEIHQIVNNCLVRDTCLAMQDN